MDAKLKRKWMKALRSGRYKQAREKIGTIDSSNCCLGVLCRVARLAPALWYAKSTGSQVLEFGVRRQLGLTKRIQSRLVHMNDGRIGSEQQSFSSIADYVESHL